MTRKEMFKRIREKLGLRKEDRLPKPEKIPTKILLEIGIEKWENMPNYLDSLKFSEWNDNVHFHNPHLPKGSNCSLCHKFLNSAWVCPLCPFEDRLCDGNCIHDYDNFIKSLFTPSRRNPLISINKIVNRLKKELQKEVKNEL